MFASSEKLNKLVGEKVALVNALQLGRWSRDARFEIENRLEEVDKDLERILVEVVAL